jgi:hypothetical protein
VYQPPKWHSSEMVGSGSKWVKKDTNKPENFQPASAR